LHLYCAPHEIFLGVGAICEVKSTSNWVLLIERYVVFLPRFGVCDENTLEDLVEEVSDDGLRNLDPRPFYGDEGVADSPLLVILLSSNK